jgi:tRNA (mo5U34)-methyltransferase
MPVTDLTDSTAASLAERIKSLEPWFQNLRLAGIATAPGHFLGDYPQIKWRALSAALPASLAGASVLEVGCNAGFYAFECKRRGAARVVGVDVDEHYLAQARLASDVLDLQVEFRRASVYELAGEPERFDYVFFMGLFYHLRYPLYALDLLVKKTRNALVFQSMIRGEPPRQVADDYDFWDAAPFAQPGFPAMYFMEHSFAGDPTNWWIPNAAAMEAILRSSGLELCAHPEPETWICRPRPEQPAVWDRELAGTL